MSESVELAKQLISHPSVTPLDSGCQQLISDWLADAGFVATHLRFGEVDNLWLRRGEAAPLFVFAGHTDVVPSGPEARWSTPPFVPTLIDGQLCGRGAADMKGSIAAFIVAVRRFVADYPDHRGSIALLLTSDEEGPAVDGTVRVVEWLQQAGCTIDWCLVGEPTCDSRVGDTIKNGRRGSLSGKLRVDGVQGHVAYPHLVDNPVHRVAPLLAELASTVWDSGNDHFPPTSFQISNIHAGTGAGNVVPGEVVVDFNFRFSTAQSDAGLRQQVEAMANAHDLNYQIDWTLSGHPFLTASGLLVDACKAAIQEVTGIDSTLSTSGGTSDGRFIAPAGAEVIELGPLNATIHKIDERVGCADLDTLSAIYQRLLERLLLEDGAGSR